MPPNNQYPNQMQNPGLQQVPVSYNTKPPKPPIGFVLGLVITILLLIVATVLAILFYTQMSDYKNNSDQKSATAVATAKTAQESELNKIFEEKEKEPLKTYTSPVATGSIVIAYPKTWSAYINEQETGNLLDAYYNPNFVANVSGNSTSSVALRMQLLSSPYATVMNEFNQKVTTGKLKASPFKPEKVPGATVGVRLDGEIAQGKNGSMVVIPVRDKTLKIWTEGTGNISDFNNFVLKNLSFSP